MQFNLPKLCIRNLFSRFRFYNAFHNIAHSEKARRPRRPGLCGYFGRRACAQNLSVMQKQNAVREGKGLLLIVGDVKGRNFRFM